MSGRDDEFDDFLARRRKLFRRPEDDVLEPPHEVDRIVLRQAREAIESRTDEREIRGMAWGAPLALAASLLVAFTIILNVGMTKKQQPLAAVTVEQVAQRRDYPPAPQVNIPMAGNPASQAPRADSAAAPPAIADRSAAPLVAENEADRHAPPPPAAPQAAPHRSAGAADAVTAGENASTVIVAGSPPSEAERAVAKGSGSAAWRRDGASWLAEIQRLRAEGKNAEADAEMAEYKRQHKAYAGSPDR